MKNLYLKIIDVFEKNKNMFHEAGLMPVETIDLYDGQPFDPTNFEFTYPAVFVDYRIEWGKGNNIRKQGTLEVEIHVLTHPGPGTENFNPRMEEGLEKLEYYKLIADLMETVATDNIQRLVVTGEEPVMTDYGSYHLIKFVTTVFREKTKRYFPLSNVKPDIDIHYETKIR
ncbi:MAG: hypothetical protein ACLU6Z_02615 [Odoribacter splanchnicus]|jgi:hypothetical protein|nr:MAG TPA: hypothetical protein [Caudoviricetes sp.]DAX75396.1 MAG TPA: hypothetical protein [Caudoviricetes sp.]